MDKKTTINNDYVVEKFTSFNTYGALCASKLPRLGDIKCAEVLCVELKDIPEDYNDNVFYDGNFCFVIKNNLLSFDGEIAEDIHNLTKPAYRIENMHICWMLPLMITSFNQTEVAKPLHKTYLMVDRNTGYTKIGKSKDPVFRERTLQSEKPTISLFAICEDNVERALHSLYENKRVRGEWFDLTPNEVSNICDVYKFAIDNKR